VQPKNFDHEQKSNGCILQKPEGRRVKGVQGIYLTELITGELCCLGLSLDYLRGQCYDSTVNMSGIFTGTQMRVLEKQPLAICVHCTNHCVNLACQDLAKSVSPCSLSRTHDLFHNSNFGKLMSGLPGCYITVFQC